MEELNKRDAVRNLQRYLRYLSYEDDRLPRPPADGIFGSATAEALSEFQKTRGLAATGRADRQTWDMLFNEYSRALERNDRSVRLDFFPKAPNGYSIGIGETSLTVRILQLLLQELTAVFDTLEFSEATGIYDEVTEENIRKFQAAALLPITGRVDLRTWNRILSDYATTESAI